MKLAGFQPTTLVDYPGRVAATLFTLGCNFRCPFCHNAQLVDPARADAASLLDVDDVLDALDRRRGFLDGVVLTGGEPTLQDDLEALIVRLRGMGYLIKLDTNGSRPDVVERLLERRLLDFVAMDVKGPTRRYGEFAGVEVPMDAIDRTIAILKRSRVDYAFRTTVAPGLTGDDLAAVAAWIGPARRYVLQRFRVPPDGAKALLDPSWADRGALDERDLRAVWAAIADRFEDGGVRA